MRIPPQTVTVTAKVDGKPATITARMPDDFALVARVQTDAGFRESRYQATELWKAIQDGLKKPAKKRPDIMELIEAAPEREQALYFSRLSVGVSEALRHIEGVTLDGKAVEGDPDDLARLVGLNIQFQGTVRELARKLFFGDYDDGDDGSQ